MFQGYSLIIAISFHNCKENAVSSRIGRYSIVLVSFSEATTPALLGRVKSFSFKYRAKREEKQKSCYGKKLILEKQRPFTGCGARDASGRFFGAS